MQKAIIMLSLKRVVLCGLVILPYSISATSTLAFCKKAAQVNEPEWYKNNDCKQVGNWAEAVCYLTPPEFSKVGGGFKVCSHNSYQVTQELLV